MTRDPSPDPEAPQIDLSSAARAVVRDPGDPRIDAHLAALGLGDDAAPHPAARARGAAPATAEVDDLRRRIAQLEAEVGAGQARVRTLTIVLVAAAVAVLLLLAVVLVR
jgi:hypothetical protein